MLEFSPSTIFFTILNLLVLYFILRKLLFGRINAVLEQRAKLVQEEISSAEAKHQQAQALRDEYEGRLTDARQEAAKIVAEAQNRGQRAYEARLAQAEDDARRVQAEAAPGRAPAGDNLRGGPRRAGAPGALRPAATAAQTALNADSDRALVDAFLAEVGEPHE